VWRDFDRGRVVVGVQCGAQRRIQTLAQRLGSAKIVTIFAQETEQAGHEQWQTVTDLVRERVPKIA